MNKREREQLEYYIRLVDIVRIAQLRDERYGFSVSTHRRLDEYLNINTVKKIVKRYRQPSCKHFAFFLENSIKYD